LQTSTARQTAAAAAVGGRQYIFCLSPDYFRTPKKKGKEGQKGPKSVPSFIYFFLPSPPVPSLKSQIPVFAKQIHNPQSPKTPGSIYGWVVPGSSHAPHRTHARTPSTWIRLDRRFLPSHSLPRYNCRPVPPTSETIFTLLRLSGTRTSVRPGLGLRFQDLVEFAVISRRDIHSLTHS
jgi:hypothetical protein